MTDASLPTEIPASLAARLAGLSVKTFARHLSAGALPSTGRVHRRINLLDLEAFLQRSITPIEYLAAERASDADRHYHRTYNQQRNFRNRAATPGQSQAEDDDR